MDTPSIPQSYPIDCDDSNVFANWATETLTILFWNEKFASQKMHVSSQTGIEWKTFVVKVTTFSIFFKFALVEWLVRRLNAVWFT